MDSRASARTALPSVAAVLRRLPPTGPSGLEGLVALLLQDEIGQRVRVTSSGEQGGLDMRTNLGADVRIACEVKRYGKTAISEREILAEIEEASSSDPQLDAWALTASRSVSAQVERTAREACDRRGIELLILDCAVRSRDPARSSATPPTPIAWQRPGD